jgi:excisionase family DNA binding protein
MLTVKQAAESIGVSSTIVYDWVNSGALAHYRVGRMGSRGSVRISQSDFTAFLETLKRGKEPRTRKSPAPTPSRRTFKHLRLKPS